METLIVHTDTADKLKALKAVLKVLDISFEKSPYNPEFVAKIRQGEKDLKEGKGVSISLDEIWK